MATTVYSSDIPGDPSVRMCWSAIFAGWFVATGIAILLYGAGMALGFSAFSPHHGVTVRRVRMAEAQVEHLSREAGRNGLDRAAGGLSDDEHALRRDVRHDPAHLPVALDPIKTEPCATALVC